MKKKTFVLLFILISLNFIGLANAVTLVAGKIYNADFTETIPGAQVRVTCFHLNEEDGSLISTSQDTRSLEDGTYSVAFRFDSRQFCDEGDRVTVEATKGNLYGSASGIVHDEVLPDLDLAVVNVPLVPEFGLIAGMITITGALVLFFVVRKN